MVGWCGGLVNWRGDTGYPFQCYGYSPFVSNYPTANMGRSSMGRSPEKDPEGCRVYNGSLPETSVDAPPAVSRATIDISSPVIASMKGRKCDSLSGISLVLLIQNPVRAGLRMHLHEELPPALTLRKCATAGEESVSHYLRCLSSGGVVVRSEVWQVGRRHALPCRRRAADAIPSIHVRFIDFLLRL